VKSSENTKLHAVLVTYWGGEWIEKCLSSLIEADPEITIHVVDNASEDDSVVIAQKFTDSICRLETNYGFGAANNIGIQNSLNQGATHILLLNQDCYIHKNAFTEIWKNIENLPELSVHAMLQLDGTGQGLDKQWKSNYISEHNCPDLIEDLILGRLKAVYPIKFANAAAWVVPKKVFEVVGGFSPTFFHYAEDSDWVNRCNFHDIPMYLHPKSTVLHDRMNRKSQKVNFLESTIGSQRKLLIQLSDPGSESSLARIVLQDLTKKIRAIINSLIVSGLVLKNHHLKNVRSNRSSTKNFKGAFLNLKKK